MEKLFVAAALFALMLWIWSEYFRAIPDLEQTGVLKNFQVVSTDTMSGQFMVLDKRYYSAGQRFLHPAAPTVVGGFQDLAYVSNIDLLLSSGSQSRDALKQLLEWSQQQRCFTVQNSKMSATQFEQRKAELQNVSVIAASKQVADQIRRVKTGQRIQIRGEWVEVNSTKTGRPYSTVDFQSQNPCGILKINSISTLN